MASWMVALVLEWRAWWMRPWMVRWKRAVRIGGGGGGGGGVGFWSAVEGIVGGVVGRVEVGLFVTVG